MKAQTFGFPEEWEKIVILVCKDMVEENIPQLGRPQQEKDSKVDPLTDHQKDYSLPTVPLDHLEPLFNL